MRVQLTLAYNGRHYLGSQTQTETSNTILGNLELVLAKLGIKTKVVASGRTDKGVHATAQVCHLDLPTFWSDLNKLQFALNSMLPKSIYVKKIVEVNDAFHARYDAKKRTYRYLIKEGNSNPFENDFVSFLPSVDFKQLQQNIQLFEGVHDFAMFMKTGSDIGSTSREIFKAFAYKYKDMIVLNFQANGFLRAQIRMMVGALLTLDAKEIQEQLNLEKKHKVKPAPANGLYLAKINY